NWPSIFKRAERTLYESFGSYIIDIHHIGSTSVNGLKANPIIDIMPVVKNISRVDGFDSEMIAVGYEPKGENGITGRRYFQKGGDKRTHHVHMFEKGNPEINRHLAFRDYLRAHSDVMKAYGNLKAELAGRYPDDIQAYIHGKEQLVLEINDKAMSWYRSLHK